MDMDRGHLVHVDMDWRRGAAQGGPNLVNRHGNWLPPDLKKTVCMVQICIKMLHSSIYISRACCVQDHDGTSLANILHFKLNFQVKPKLHYS